MVAETEIVALLLKNNYNFIGLITYLPTYLLTYYLSWFYVQMPNLKNEQI